MNLFFRILIVLVITILKENRLKQNLEVIRKLLNPPREFSAPIQTSRRNSVTSLQLISHFQVLATLISDFGT